MELFSIRIQRTFQLVSTFVCFLNLSFLDFSFLFVVYGHDNGDETTSYFLHHHVSKKNRTNIV